MPFFLSVCLSGCTSFFFRPTRTDYTAQWKERDQYLSQNDFLQSKSGNRLNYWVFKSQIKNKKAKALIVQFHGNAQNLSIHFVSQGWLADFGYDFLTFDYSGYGKSEGKANIKTALQDAESILEFITQKAKQQNAPVILYGQSLGGALLLKSLKTKPKDFQPCLTIIESSFYSYPKIAQSVAKKHWLLWPFQWVPLLSLSKKYNPGGKDLKLLEKYNKLVLHAKKDPIVPFAHGKKLFEQMSGSKDFWTYSKGHISFWQISKNQQKLVQRLDRDSENCRKTAN